ncbi:MAG TPA: Rv3235 family protein, partial [Mycobacterium sp.]|nr:Rv3235 family protein [Mycobacterium sp.]
PRPGRSTARARRTEGHRHLPHRAAAVVAPARGRTAGTFADAALRTVLEVIDRRRPAAQLRALMTAPLVDSVVSVVHASPHPDGVARLRRVHVQAVDPDERAFEIAACYDRGIRSHALACRIERLSSRWRVVALHLG